MNSGLTLNRLTRDRYNVQRKPRYFGKGIEIGKTLKAVEMLEKLRAESFPFEEALKIAEIDKNAYDKYLKSVTSQTAN